MNNIISILSSLDNTKSVIQQEAIKDCIYAANCSKTALTDHLFIWTYSTMVDNEEDKEYKEMIFKIKEALKGEIVNVEI